MIEKSRTEYSARNTTVAVIARVTAIVMGFVARVVFTHTLTEDYVGINGLFTDILNVLALSELGVGTAVTYALYKPIAEQDIEKQKSLMQLYKSFYRMVAIIVLAVGLLVIPCMDVIIKDKPQVEYLTLIYLMYLTNSVISYFWIYKRTLIDAHQLSYIGVLYQTFSWVIQNVLQIIILLTTRNFVLYLSVQILCTIINNVCVSVKADKLYPYLKDKDVEKLSKEEKLGIVQNIRAMLMHKVGNVVVNNTDNLLLSALVGTISVGRYSNYYLIIGSARQVLEQMFRGITASVGNMGVEESKERIKRIFEATFFLGQWVYGLVAICMYEVLDLFVGLSFGTQYVFTSNVTLVLCLNFYLNGMRQATLVFRDSMGLFWYDRYKSIAEAVINLMVSLVLGKYFGVVGVFLGTMISTVTTSLWVEPYMLYKHKLQVSCKVYFLKYFMYAAATFLLWYGEDLLCKNVTGNSWRVCLLRVMLCFVITNLAYLIIYHRTKEFKLLIKKAVRLIRKYLGKDKLVVDVTDLNNRFSKEEQYLLKLLTAEMTDIKFNTYPADINWEELIGMAGRHGVLSLLYDSLAEQEQVPVNIRIQVKTLARKTVQQSYHLLFLSKYLIGELEKRGIPTVLLKGVTVANFYRVPELRKSGDVDLLLLNPQSLSEACTVLEKAGCIMMEKQDALHHVVYQTGDGIEIELHTMLAEPFDNNKTNRYIQNKLRECSENVRLSDIMGVEIPVLHKAFHAYELVLHMLQHFLRSGFGLKLLCDWVVFWEDETEKEEQEKYLQLVTESGIKGFSDIVTLTCCKYLGLDQEKIKWMDPEAQCNVDEFLSEILEAEEFGKSSKDRMVVLRGNRMQDYFREFHHQMQLNFPRLGKCFLCWPVLWIITLVRFVRNNRKIREVSEIAILKKAGQRSKMVKALKLFKDSSDKD